jgi:hypothetical protein
LQQVNWIKLTEFNEMGQEDVQPQDIQDKQLQSIPEEK